MMPMTISLDQYDLHRIPLQCLSFLWGGEKFQVSEIPPLEWIWGSCGCDTARNLDGCGAKALTLGTVTCSQQGFLILTVIWKEEKTMRTCNHVPWTAKHRPAAGVAVVYPVDLSLDPSGQYLPEPGAAVFLLLCSSPFSGHSSTPGDTL